MRVHPELPVDQIDKIISAEIPHENTCLKEIVKKYMLHRQQHSPRCLHNGTCIYHYPKPIIPETYIDEREAIENFSTPAQLRFLFTQLILDGAPTLDIWQKFNSNLSADIYSNYPNAINTTLQQIATLLAEHGRRLHDFGLPEPQTWTKEVTMEYQRHSDYARYSRLAEEFCLKMTSEQLTFHNEVIAHILWKPEEGPIPISKFPKFLDGKAGRGKTFLINAICHSIRAAKKIVLPCGTTALAALLYEG
ncbi:26676_t:CDS:2, partial [Racocetra persica]